MPAGAGLVPIMMLVLDSVAVSRILTCNLLYMTVHYSLIARLGEHISCIGVSGNINWIQHAKVALLFDEIVSQRNMLGTQVVNSLLQ